MRRRLVGKGPLARSLAERARAALRAREDGGTTQAVMAGVRSLVAARAVAKTKARAARAAAAVTAVAKASAMKTMRAKKTKESTDPPALLKAWKGVPKQMAKTGQPVSYKGGWI